MSPFRWTGLEFGALAVTVAVLAGLAWMQVEKRRDERGSVLDRLVWVPGAPLTDERVDAEFAGLLPEVEQGLKSALHEENVARLNELALNPMPQRPSPPLAAPGEPWQLRRPVGADVPPGLVDPGVSNDTLDGEQQ